MSVLLVVADVHETLSTFLPALPGRPGAARQDCPPEWLPGPAFMLAEVDGPLTVLVGPALAARWGLQFPDYSRVRMPAVPGWSAGTAGPWVTYTRDRDHLRVSFGFWHWMAGNSRPEREWPLFGDLVAASPARIPAEVIGRFHMWQNVTGYAYRGSPGVAGTIMLRGLYPEGRAPFPRWQLRPVPALERAHEAELHWQTTCRLPRGHTVTYDRRRAYLASALTVEVAAGDLEPDPTPGQPFDPRRSGWWMIDPDPWTFHQGIPDPLEGMYALGGIWVTTPTLQLLDELREAGVYGGYRILQSRTAPATRLLRSWAELIRDGERALTGKTDSSATAVRATLKEAYRRAIGLMARRGGSIWRPDWQAAIIAHTRAQVLRQIITTYRTTQALPVAVAVDAVSYPAAVGDPVAQATQLRVRLGAGIGNWRIAEPRQATHA